MIIKFKFKNKDEALEGYAFNKEIIYTLEAVLKIIKNKETEIIFDTVTGEVTYKDQNKDIKNYV